MGSRRTQREGARETEAVNWNTQTMQNRLHTELPAITGAYKKWTTVCTRTLQKEALAATE